MLKKHKKILHEKKTNKNVLSKIINKKYNIKQIFNELNIKNGLMKKLFITFTSVILISMIVLMISTFSVSKRKITEDFKNSTNQILNQNKNYVKLITDNIDEISTQILSNGELSGILSKKASSVLFEKYQQQNKANTYLKNILYSSSQRIIQNIYIFNNKGYNISTNDKEITNYNKLKQTKWYKKTQKLNGMSNWSPVYKNFFDENKEVISLQRVFKNINNIKPIGMIHINVNPDIFYNTISTTKLGKTGYMFITDKDENIIAHKDKKLIGTKIKSDYFAQIKNKNAGDFTFNENGQKMYGIYETMENPDWKFIAVIPQKELYSTATGIGKISLLILMLCLVISIIISLIFASAITKPIKEVISVTNKVAAGDFTVKANSYKINELSQLGNTLNNMINQLRTVLDKTSQVSLKTIDSSKRLLNISGNVSSSTKEIALSVQEISKGSTKQTEETVNCAKTTNKFNNEITTATNSLNEVIIATHNTIEVLNKGTDVISTLNKTSLNNSNSMEKVSNTVSELSENNKNILSIIEKINNITKMTNLLSLNAAIEAARAGEAGKGFAVVANEIRKLAEQSQEAAHEIGNIINKVNDSISESLDISKEAKIAFKDELQQVSKAVKSFHVIGDSIDKISESMKVTMNSINIINTDKDVVNDSINNIAAISQENTAATEEVSASIEEESVSTKNMENVAEDLNVQADGLKKTISKFKI